MKNKIYKDVNKAIEDIHDDATIMIGGFAGRGTPSNIVYALREKGVKNLTIITCVSSGGWKAPIDVDILVENNQAAKVISAFPVFGSPKRISAVEKKVSEGQCEAEVVPMGTLIERIRAGGAGMGGFYTPTGIGTEVAKGKDIKKFDGKEMILERALKADFALVKCHRADKMGNLVYRMSTRNYNPIIAMAAKTTIVETENLVEIGDIGPDEVHTPCIFVHRIVHFPKKR